MNPSNLKDLKQLALLAELTRPLTHECNNFLNNLLLQLAISEKSFPESSRTEWSNIRREGKKLAGLFQQWQRYRKESGVKSATIDLNHVIDDVVEELRADSGASRFLVHPTSEPVWLKGAGDEVHRLFTLLLRYCVTAIQSTGVDNTALEIHLGQSGDRIEVRLLKENGADDAMAIWADFDDLASSNRISLSLPSLACKSLVDRLDGNIRLARRR